MTSLQYALRPAEKVDGQWRPKKSLSMNWRFTRACTVEFAIGEPICLFFPIQRGALEMFRGEFRMLEANQELESKFREWSISRDRFLLGLGKGKPEIVAQGWQKDYMRTAKTKNRSCIHSQLKPRGLRKNVAMAIAMVLQTHSLPVWLSVHSTEAVQV